MNISNYKKEVKNRMILGGVMVLVSAILLITVLYVQNNVIEINGFRKGFPQGAVTAIGFLGLWGIIANNKLLKNEDKLKKSYIKENDERDILVNYKSYTLAYGVALFLMLTGAIVASFISVESLILMIALIALSLVSLFISLSYFNKLH